MLKKSILLGMLGLCIGNVGYSASLASLFHPKTSALPTAQIQSNAPTNYTDFTGKWIGHCNDSDNLVTIKLENDDYTLTINHLEFNITGLNSVSNSVAIFSDNETTILNWNDDKTALIFNEINYYHRASSQMPPQTSTLEVEIGRGMLELKNGELVYSSTTTTFKDGLAVGNAESSVCRFTKK